MSKKTVVFDFDGVIHSYSSGWQGETVIPDPPVPGIKEAIADIREDYFVVVVSTRCTTEEGKAAIEAWLSKHGIEVDKVTKEKPPAIVYIDDRAICFDGNAASLKGKIENFEPWYHGWYHDENGRLQSHYGSEPVPKEEVEKWVRECEELQERLYAAIAGQESLQRYLDREGEWEKRDFIIMDFVKTGYRCTSCNTTWDAPTKFCPNCGAKMKGE